MLVNIFWSILDMSIAASIAAGIIILFRRLLSDKLPRIFSYVVWGIVLIRLLIPISISSNFSIFNVIHLPSEAVNVQINTNESQQNIVESDKFIDKATDSNNDNKEQADFSFSDISGNSDVIALNNISSSTKSDLDFSSVITNIWFSVVLLMLGLSSLAYFKASKRFKTAVLYRDNALVEECHKRLNLSRTIKVYTSDIIDTPVVVGFFRVRIILPLSYAQKCSQEDLKYMITHEMVHIKRLDYIVKLLSVIALCLHWFNPIIWLSFILAQKDMEMSCDARVLSTYSKDVRSAYAMSLINIAARQNVLFNGGLLAFGESNIKARIKGIMKFKKTRVWIGVTALAILVILGPVLLTNGQNNDSSNNNSEVVESDQSVPIIIDENDLSNFLMHRSKYIGDASNVSNLLGKLPYSDLKEGISLKTDSEPYEITINYNMDDVDDIDKIKPILLDNALIIFSLIENVDTVNFRILSTNPNEVQFERAEMQKYFAKDLWIYSDNKRAFEEFLMDISFDVLIYPESYTPVMSIVPGMQIGVSLNAAYYNLDFTTKYSVEYGSLHTWIDGIVSDSEKTINMDHGFVYWSPLDMLGTDKENEDDTVTISILDKEGNTVIEKQISITKDEELFYTVNPSHDVLTDNFYKFDYE